MDRFTAWIINRNLGENKGKRAAALAQLKISKRLLYTTLARERGPEGK